MKKNKIKRNKPSRLLKISFILCMVWTLTGCSVQNGNNGSDIDTGLLKVMYLDVGQGESILIESRGEAMLIDAGEAEKGDTVVTDIKGENIGELKYVIGTHPHSDHIGGLAQVIQTFKTEEVFLSDVSYNSREYDNLLQAIGKKIKMIHPSAGDTYQLGNASFTFLTPLKGDYGDNTNNYSLGIRLVNGKNSFLFTGDLEEKAEKDLVLSGRNIGAEVLKVNHHGSLTSSCTEFLKAVDPTYAVISCGKNNIYGQIKGRAFLAHISRRKIDGYPFCRQTVTGIFQRNADPLPGFPYLRSQVPYQIKYRQAVTDVCFYRDNPAFNSMNSSAKDFTKH
jgi:competence protein ComEC